MEAKNRDLLENVYSLFGNGDAITNSVREQIVTPYIAIDTSYKDSFSRNITSFLESLQSCKELFPEMTLLEVKQYEEKYSDDIMQ